MSELKYAACGVLKSECERIQRKRERRRLKNLRQRELSKGPKRQAFNAAWYEKERLRQERGNQL